MSSQARQLLLEVLLLAERYTEREISWVRKELARHTKAIALVELIAQGESGTSSANLQRDRRARPSDSDLKRSKTALIGRLRRESGTKAVRRAEAMAKRLDVPLKGQSHNELVKELSDRLDRLGDDELARFLKPYRLGGQVDEGYIGLANFIMKTGDEAK